eukprot:TRINITY_DN26371_c0_g1_i1.p1 TRINITY_DN26371_c0_g1~~TRINITY_DN26371_c0_g1_i1.p1  ORF type:complete len:129 (+),score=18.49 TRINITY_DN26371_c0_g1_i1:56-442(+)
MAAARILIALPFSSSSSWLGKGTIVVVVRASASTTTRNRRKPFLARAQQQQDENISNASYSQDLNYLWKLAAWSVGSGSLIKYGSALVPEITRPNIFQALLMILIPVLVSILILVKQSRMESQNQDPS